MKENKTLPNAPFPISTSNPSYIFRLPEKNCSITKSFSPESSPFLVGKDKLNEGLFLMVVLMKEAGACLFLVSIVLAGCIGGNLDSVNATSNSTLLAYHCEGYSCVKGAGDSFCKVSDDCSENAPRHTICEGAKCVSVPGYTVSYCDAEKSYSCGHAHHNSCDSSNQCITIAGEGNDSCDTLHDCPLKGTFSPYCYMGRCVPSGKRCLFEIDCR